MVQTRYIRTKLTLTTHPLATYLQRTIKGVSECLCQTAFWGIWSSLSLWEWSGKRHHQGESIVLMEPGDVPGT